MQDNLCIMNPPPGIPFLQKERRGICPARIMESPSLSQLLSYVDQARREFGEIPPCGEEPYLETLLYIETNLITVHRRYPARVTEENLIPGIANALYRLYTQWEKDRLTRFDGIIGEGGKRIAHACLMAFDPHVNPDIPLRLPREQFRTRMTAPVRSLLRVYDSVQFWQEHGEGYYPFILGQLGELTAPMPYVGAPPPEIPVSKAHCAN